VSASIRLCHPVGCGTATRTSRGLTKTDTSSSSTSATTPSIGWPLRCRRFVSPLRRDWQCHPFSRLIAHTRWRASGSSKVSTARHGDFGPQNILFTADAEDVVGVLDWEFAHEGSPIEDIAWCEWIVRMHHPGAATQLTVFFEAFGTRPTWQARHAEMLRRCASLQELCRRWGDHNGVALWNSRLDATLAWVE